MVGRGGGSGEAAPAARISSGFGTCLWDSLFAQGTFVPATEEEVRPPFLASQVVQHTKPLTLNPDLNVKPLTQNKSMRNWLSTCRRAVSISDACLRWEDSYNVVHSPFSPAKGVQEGS
jgi:hypothetical protein